MPSSNKSSRFPGLAFDRSGTRKTLRQQFANLLGSARFRSAKRKDEFALSDEFLLKLLQSTEFVHTYSLASARSAYQERPEVGGGPSFDDLAAEGWIQVVRDRIVIPVGFLRPYKRTHPDNAEAFEWLQQHQYDVHYSARPSADPDVVAVLEALDSGTLALQELRSPRPEWVAARRWEQLCSEESDPVAALYRWLDDWKVLGWPTFVPAQMWSGDALQQFHTAGLTVIEAEPLAGWSDIHERIAAHMAHEQDASVDLARQNLAPVPPTIVERYEWVTSRGVERAFISLMWSLEGFSALIGLFVKDIEETDNSAAPHPLWNRLFPLISRSAELLFVFGLQPSARPMPMADMLLSPQSAPLACLFLWQWSLPGDALAGKEVKDSLERRKEEAFLDGTEVLRFMVDDGEVPPEEVAALIRIIFGSGIASTGSSEEGTERMRQIFVRALSEISRTNLKAVIESSSNFDVGGPGEGLFAGLLSLLDASGYVTGIEGRPIVDGYTSALGTGGFRLSARNIGKGQAASLYGLALQSGGEALERFLKPLDLASRLAIVSTNAGTVEAFEAIESAKRSIRVHVRMLCRIISSGQSPVTEELLTALISAVRSGALNRLERMQVDAFSASFDADLAWTDKDRPISADLGQALTSLSEQQQRRLFRTVLEIEEPATLAQLLFYVPSVLHPAIQDRVKALTPESSSDLSMLAAEQARIEHLLDAGLADVASVFLEAEGKLETRGKVPGRSLQRLRFRLRLLLLREKWAELDNVSLPEDDAELDKAAAQDAIDFFRALSKLRRRDSDVSDAIAIFERLHTRHRDIPAYYVNLHASRVSAILGEDKFGYVKEDQLAMARTIFTDGQKWIAETRGYTEKGKTTVLLNSALLSLAIKQPRQALSLLQTIDADRPLETLFAYRALALDRSGEPALAQATLVEAESKFGKTPLIEATAKQISLGSPFIGPVSSVSDEDSVLWIRRAHAHLHLLSATDQARALSPDDSTIGEFLLRHIREASSGVTQLVPMMRNLGLSSLEDDVTAVLKEILNARLRIVNWALGDQPKGGFTAEGNPGERDLVITRDTATLTIVEAVMVRRPMTHADVRDDLTLHFVKLFGYGNCQVYFHVTYVMTSEVPGVLEHLKAVARDNPPAGIEYLKAEDLPFSDSGPRGFSATYRSDSGERQVHFLVLDLNQGLEKNAAKAAQSLKPKPAEGAAKRKRKKGGQ